MREILFRGKCVDNKEWFFGHLIKEISTERTFICDIAHMDKSTTVDNISCEVLPETVGQYTGLKDRNGNMIFEGDVVYWFPYYDKKIKEFGTIIFGEFECDQGWSPSNSNHNYTFDFFGWHIKTHAGKVDGETDALKKNSRLYVIGTIHDEVSK